MKHFIVKRFLAALVLGLAACAVCGAAWADTENYDQDWLFESRGSWQNVSWIQDNQGQTYFKLYDSAGANT